MKKSIITISREYGSGGYEIGQKLAERLGFQFYDKELIAQLAEKLMVSEAFVEKQEAAAPKRNIFHEIVPFFSNGANDDTDYIFAEQGKFIVRLANHGNCVIAGRRADYYLRDNPDALHLFFYADDAFKIKRIMESEQVSEEEAAKRIADTDRRRKTSYEYTTGRRWADRHNYDRMICTSTLGIDACVEEIAALIE